MIFTSFEFLLFFGILFILFFRVPHAYRWILLLASSYFFYAFREPINLLFLVIPTLIIYAAAMLLDSLEPGGKKKILLFAGIAAGLGCLLVFKYAGFMKNTLHSLFGLFSEEASANPVNFILPIGISFYSFK